MNRIPIAKRLRSSSTKLLLCLLLLALCLSSCSDQSIAADTPSESGSHESGVLENVVIPYADYFSSEDIDASWNDTTATSISFDGTRVEVKGSGATASEQLVTITQAGTYLLSGVWDEGQVLIDAGKTDIVRLVLNGIRMHNSSSSVIYAKNAAKTVLVLADGTENQLSDSDSYLFEEGSDEPDATVFAKNDLSIVGNGRLNIEANYRNGLASKDYLLIASANLTIDAVHDGLRGRDGVIILDGTFRITAGNDGIKANHDTDTARGFIIIDGGSFEIDSGHDAIQAETNLDISGGDFTVVSGGGAANAPLRQEENFGMGGMGRGGGAFNGQQIPPEWPGNTTDATIPTMPPSQEALPDSSTEMPPETGATTIEVSSDSESTSMKGFKAGLSLSISAGSFSIDAADDAFHSNGDLKISGGSFVVKSGDDAFHADLSLVIEEGDIDIQQCYEGLEGTNVTISGGKIRIVASDDAINAADSSTTATMQPGRMNIDENIYIRISGGFIDATAAYDTLDSNGNIFIEGGTIYLSGPSNGMDGAIDMDGTFYNNGGTLVAAGSVMSPSSESLQPILIVSYNSEQAQGTVLTLKDAEGKTILSYSAAKSFRLAAFSSGDLQLGQSYTICSGDTELCRVTLSDTITGINEDGSSYTATNGFGGGMRGNRNTAPTGEFVPGTNQRPQGP